MDSYELLSIVQQKLKAPKGQFNSFGNYKYRSCEDILEAVKPVLGKCSITLSDEIVMVHDRIYVKATATFRAPPIVTIIQNKNGGESVVRPLEPISVTAYAREPLLKKGMDESQITGTASSYARKYALNGLLCIDDAKDADTDEHRKQITPNKQEGVQVTGDPGEFVAPVGAAGVKGKKLKDIPANQLTGAYEYFKGLPNLKGQAALFVAQAEKYLGKV